MLTLVYMAFAGFGCLYVLVAAFLGHGDDLGGHAAPAGHAGPHAGVDSAAAGHGAAAGGAGHATETYGFGGEGHGGVSAHAAAGASFHFPFFSPLALATTIAAIGAFGLIGKFALAAGDGASLAIAVPAALATAYGVTYLAWKIAGQARASSVIQLAGLVGATAEVTVPIAPGGVGEALCMAGGERYAAPAREVSGGALARGARAVIVAVSGATLLVRAAGGAAPPEGASHE